MHLALTDMFNARWSDEIHEEWIRNLLNKRPDLTREQLNQTKELMDAHVREAKVENYEPLISTLPKLPDPLDAHVLAAAIKSNSDGIVTFNLKDFPAAILENYHIEAIHPDDFVQHQIDLDPGRVCQAVKRHRTGLRNPPRNVDEYLSSLNKQSLPQTVQSLSKFSALI
ncbi:MAG: PIN domain-containing protein [Pseudomonadota bacterium]